MSNIIEIIEETPDWIAVSKPAGLSVHNDEDGFNLLSILSGQLDCKLHAAHRLDQPTSGVMLLGKNPKAQRCFKSRSPQPPKNIPLFYVER